MPPAAPHKATHLATIGITVQRPLRWDAARECFINDDIADRLLSRPMRQPWSLNA